LRLKSAPNAPLYCLALVSDAGGPDFQNTKQESVYAPFFTPRMFFHLKSVFSLPVHKAANSRLGNEIIKLNRLVKKFKQTKAGT
jgi:hypothetical protein